MGTKRSDGSDPCDATEQTSGRTERQILDRVPRVPRYRGRVDDRFQSEADLSEVSPDLGMLGDSSRGKRRPHGVHRRPQPANNGPIRSPSRRNYYKFRPILEEMSCGRCSHLLCFDDGDSDPGRAIGLRQDASYRLFISTCDGLGAGSRPPLHKARFRLPIVSNVDRE